MCNIYQYIKSFRYRFYNKFNSFFIISNFFFFFFINFVINLSFNKYKNIIYNFILIIIDRFIKMIKYLLINIIIDVVALTKFFYIKIIYYYDILNDIVNNRNSIFINIF